MERRFKKTPKIYEPVGRQHNPADNYQSHLPYTQPEGSNITSKGELCGLFARSIEDLLI